MSASGGRLLVRLEPVTPLGGGWGDGAGDGEWGWDLMARTITAGGSREGKDWHTEEYRQYLLSADWQKRRYGVLLRDNHQCRRCGAVATEVHHRTYERLGKEFMSDLESLCRDCHEQADSERQKETASRNAEKLYDARLDGWASKRYGDNWDTDQDFEVVEEAFDRWLESRGENDDWAEGDE